MNHEYMTITRNCMREEIIVLKICRQLESLRLVKELLIKSETLSVSLILSVLLLTMQYYITLNVIFLENQFSRNMTETFYARE